MNVTLDWCHTAHAHPVYKTTDSWHPLALSAKANPEDCPTHRKTCNIKGCHERRLWFDSVTDEWNAVMGKGCFKIIGMEPVQAAVHDTVPTT